MFSAAFVCVMLFCFFCLLWFGVRMKGEIPAEMGNFTVLQVLCLSSNKLTGK